MPTKKDIVYYHLKGLLENNSMPEKQLFNLSIKDLQDMEELKGVGKTTLSEGYNEFRRQNSTFIEPPDQFIKPDPDTKDSDLLSLLEKDRDLLLEMLDEFRMRKQVHQLDLTDGDKSSIKNVILKQFSIHVPKYNEGHGLGVKISDDVFKRFQTMVRDSGLTQREGLHIALIMFAEHVEELLSQEPD
jgi:hypothetical protein